MSKVLQELIPNVGSRVREHVKAVSLAFVLLDFQKNSVVYEISVHRHVAVQRSKLDQNHL